MIVTSAAYLLFYRRRTESVLGGPFFEKLFAVTDGDNIESQPTSRAPSPAGEGKRLDGSSRNGSSSALRGVGAAHQAGVGGADETVVSTRTGVDDDLPAYSMRDPLRNTINPQELAANTLESMEVDGDGEVDEGIADIHPALDHDEDSWTALNDHSEPSWSFGNYDKSHRKTGRHGSDVGDEDLFGGDNSSTKVANSSVSDTGEDRMADFGDDNGSGSRAFGTPEEEPLLDVPPMEEEPEQPVAEVMLEDENYKMD